MKKKIKQKLIILLATLIRNPLAYILYSEVEEDNNTAINYLKEGLVKYNNHPKILLQLFEKTDDNYKEDIIKLVSQNNIVDYNILIDIIQYLISKDRWILANTYIEKLLNNCEITTYEKNEFDLLSIYSKLLYELDSDIKSIINDLIQIIDSDLDNDLNYSSYIAIIYAYILDNDLENANLYFDKIPINNTISDFIPDIYNNIYVDLSKIYKLIFDKFTNVYKNDTQRKNKGKALYILYLYKPSEIFNTYRYTKKDLSSLERIFSSIDYNIDIAIALYNMNIHFGTIYEAYEILLKILANSHKISNHSIDTYALFNNCTPELLIKISDNIANFIQRDDVFINYNEMFKLFINDLIEQLFNGKMYYEITQICDNLSDKIIMEFDSEFYVAYAYCEENQNEKSLKYYKDILLKNPNNSSALNNIALLYENSNNLEDAFFNIKKAKELENDELHSRNYDRISKKLEEQELKQKLDKNFKLQSISNNLTIENLEKLGYNTMLQNKLDNICDIDLREILKRDLKECAYSVLLEQNKSAIVLSGSIIEALLIYIIKDHGILEYDLVGLRNRKSTCMKQIDEMILDELLFVSNKSKLLSDTNYYLSHFSREYRNVIHPNKEIRGKMEISTENAHLMWKILKEIIFELL